MLKAVQLGELTTLEQAGCLARCRGGGRPPQQQTAGPGALCTGWRGKGHSALKVSLQSAPTIITEVQNQ